MHKKCRDMKNWLPVALLFAAGGVIAYLLITEFWGHPLRLVNPNQIVEVSEDSSTTQVNFQFACSKETTITHVESSCDCAVFDRLPITISAGETAVVKAEIDLSKIKTIPAKRSFLFYLNPPIARPLATVELVHKQGIGDEDS